MREEDAQIGHLMRHFHAFCVLSALWIRSDGIGNFPTFKARITLRVYKAIPYESVRLTHQTQVSTFQVDMKEIVLSQGKIAFVDDVDYQLVSQFKWHAEKRKSDIWYAKRNLYKPDGMRTTQYLHQFLIPGAKQVDHRDGNGLNNQRHNIRPCTQAQNMCNAKRQTKGSSRFKGVSYRYHRWQAGIRFQSKSYHLGSFLVEEDAARAYDVAAKKFHGEFARLNFPA